MTQVNDLRAGYPRFTGLLAAYPSFNIYRRFSAIRARLMLDKQDRLASLEAELQHADDEEEIELFLGSMRRDSNPIRKRILADMDVALADYELGSVDNLIGRSSRALSFATACPRDILSLQNWVAGTASLARDETAYLSQTGDLFNAGMANEDADAHVEPLLEAFASRLYERFCKYPGLPLSENPGVFVVASPIVKPLTRVLLAFLLVVLLMAPVAVVNAVESLRMRMLVIGFATLTVVLGICSLTKVKLTKVFLCGATYTTILVVFVGGPGSSTQ